MCLFLQLPRELRNEIYNYVLSAEIPPPPPHPEYNSCTDWSGKGSHLKLDPKPPRIQSLPLLHTCHQLHAEVLDLLHRNQQHHTTYKLDCLIEDEQSIYPFWTLLPALPTSIPAHFATLSIKIRLSGLISSLSSFRIPSPWERSEDGSPGPLAWSFLALLQRILQRGPHVISAPKPDRGIRIGELRVEVDSQGVSGQGLLRRRRWFDPSPATRTGKRDALWVARELERVVDGVFVPLREGWARGQMEFLDGCVDRVVVLYDGQVRRAWDLTT